MLKNLPWWRIAQVIIALSLLSAIETNTLAPKRCFVDGIVGPNDVYGATIQLARRD